MNDVTGFTKGQSIQSQTHERSFKDGGNYFLFDIFLLLPLGIWILWFEKMKDEDDDDDDE